MSPETESSRIRTRIILGGTLIGYVGYRDHPVGVETALELKRFGMTPVIVRRLKSPERGRNNTYQNRLVPMLLVQEKCAIFDVRFGGFLMGLSGLQPLRLAPHRNRTSQIKLGYQPPIRSQAADRKVLTPPFKKTVLAMVGAYP